MKKLLFFGTLLCFLLLFALTTAAMEIEVVDDLQVIDNNHTFGYDINEGDTGDVRFILFTTTTNTQKAINDQTLAVLFRIEEDDSAIALVIRTTGKSADFYYDIYTFGDAYDMFTQSDVDRILDDEAVLGNIKGGTEITKGAKRFFTLAATHVAEYYEAQHAVEARRVPMAILVGVLVGLLAGGGAALGIFLYYRRRQHGESYPLDRYAKLNLTVRTDRFVGSFVARTRVQSNNGASGGRSGGGFSGAHRGGR